MRHTWLVPRRPIVAAALGIAEMKNIEAFEAVAVRLTDCLNKIADICDAAATSATEDAADK